MRITVRERRTEPLKLDLKVQIDNESAAVLVLRRRGASLVAPDVAVEPPYWRAYGPDLDSDQESDMWARGGRSIAQGGSADSLVVPPRTPCGILYEFEFEPRASLPPSLLFHPGDLTLDGKSLQLAPVALQRPENATRSW